MAKQGRWVGSVLGVFLVGWGAVSVPASEGPPSAEKMMDTIEALRARLRDQERRLAAMEAKTAALADEKAYREELRGIVEEILTDKDLAASWPAWMENLTFYGDFRLRYEYRQFAESRGANDDEGRARYRLRFGLRKTWPEDGLEVGFRIASGDGGGPTSTNETMGDFFFRDEWRIDRAYVRWTPKPCPGLLVTAGKIAQPWVATDLVWDSDLNPEGAWVQYTAPCGEGLRPFVAMGQFFLSNNNPGDDAHLQAYSMGLDWDPCDGLAHTVAATYYNTDHYSAGLTVPDEEWDFFNLVNVFSWKAFDLPMAAYVDWVTNVGVNHNTPSDQSTGLAFGMKVGKCKKKGSWEAKYVFKYLQLEASPRAFNDSDFPDGHKGHVWGFKYACTDSMQVGVTCFYSEPINNPDPDGDRFTLQADVAWKF